MTVTLQEFAKWPTTLPVTVHSIDMAGYQATVLIDGKTHLLMDKIKKPLHRKSLMAMREALQSMPVASLVLQHQSAYDEMINQPERERDNTLAVPLSRNLYPDSDGA